VTPGNAARSADIIASAVCEALESANLGDERPKLLYAGVAGVGRGEEKRALQAELEKRNLAEEVIVEADALIALADAFGSAAGILLIAGTGSVAFGRSPAGKFARCGGWGLAIGDEGSGAWIGRRALAVVAAAYDGREPATDLTGAIVTATQVNDVEDLIAWSIAATHADLAALAPVVFAVAENGDVRASSLVSLAVEELILHVRALALSLFSDERAAIPVALSGGLMHKGSFLRKRLEQRLKTAVPGAQVQQAQVNPARGAVKAATALLGIS
jgi:glucosamine kinase